MKTAVFVIEKGTVTAMAGGPLSLSDMGERSTERASHLEFNSATNKWTVTDAHTKEVLYQHADYDVALEWEINHYNNLLASTGQIKPTNED